MASSLETAAKRFFSTMGLAGAVIAGQAQAQSAQVKIHPPVGPLGVTCFDDLENHSTHDNSASTVLLIALDEKGASKEYFSGTIIADSEVTPGKGNRIYSVAHGLGIRSDENEPIRDPLKRIMVVSSTGKTFAGEARPVVIASRDVSQSSRDDQIVLEMVNPGDDYRAIRGAIASAQQSPSRISRATLASDSIGVDSGASGGPAFNGAGEFIGAVVAIVPAAGGAEADINATRPRLIDFSKVNSGGLPEITGDPVHFMPFKAIGAHSVYVISPSGDKILEALGNAGRRIKAGQHADQNSRILGMTDGACNAYSANVHQVDVSNPAEFVEISPQEAASRSFKSWNDPEKSLAHVRGLLRQVKAEADKNDGGLVQDGKFSQLSEWIAKANEAHKISDVVSKQFSADLADYSSTVSNPELKAGLHEAATEIGRLVPAKVLQKAFAPRAF